MYEKLIFKPKIKDSNHQCGKFKSIFQHHDFPAWKIYFDRCFAHNIYISNATLVVFTLVSMENLT